MSKPILDEVIGKKRYVIDPDLKTLADEVIRTELDIDPEISKANIKYMKVYPNVSKTVAGRCIRASNELKLFGGADYLIQMSGDLWDKLDVNPRRVLMLHELMHVYIDFNKDGEPVYKLRNHDVEDFASIIDKYGVNWLYDLRTSAAEIDDKLDPLKIRL